jgi:hypothetical protein
MRTILLSRSTEASERCGPRSRTTATTWPGLVRGRQADSATCGTDAELLVVEGAHGSPGDMARSAPDRRAPRPALLLMCKARDPTRAHRGDALR